MNMYVSKSLCVQISISFLYWNNKLSLCPWATENPVNPLKIYPRPQWSLKIGEFVIYLCGRTLKNLLEAFENSHGEEPWPLGVPQNVLQDPWTSTKCYSLMCSSTIYYNAVFWSLFTYLFWISYSVCSTLRYHSVYGLSQWETTLHCNVVSHWLSPYKEWTLYNYYTL